MPEYVETEVDNIHLIVASCWFSLSSHFAHDARSQEPKTSGTFSTVQRKSKTCYRLLVLLRK